jgi:hypothetical protein
VEVPEALSDLPGSGTLARLLYLAARPAATYWAMWRLPAGELWVPAVCTVVLCQAASCLMLPHAVYLGMVRRPSQLLVGLVPKAMSLFCLLAWPGAAASSYFSTCFQGAEGAILVWQQVVYNVSDVDDGLRHCAGALSNAAPV